MEKIYMDSENKKPKKQSFLKKLFNDNGSMTALVVIAVVGIVGLMVFGLNQISFAIDPTAQLPEKFISAQGDENVMKLTGSTIDGVDGIMPILGFYTKEEGIPIYCIEYDITYVIDKEYTPGEEITDTGLMYLMSKLYPNVSFKDASGNDLPENVQVWLSQSAIWLYLYETGDPNNQTLNSVPTAAPKYFADNVRKVNKLYRGSGSDVEYVVEETTPLYELHKINELIATAKEVKKEPAASVKAEPKSKNISITNDNKYYQTDLISVTYTKNSISTYKGYSVSLTNAPEGTILVDENGNVYDDLENMSPTSKFYVRVPVDKVTDTSKKLELSINGKFDVYGANKYVSGEYQKVANVKMLNKEYSGPLDIQLDYTPEVPDTGMGVAQTIYFMGLILLLSGVGIVYANAKPKTSE